MPKVADIAELVRLPAVLSVPGDSLLGGAASGARRSPARTAGLAGASCALYLAGMALNDWADREVDAIERPGRPIPSGRVSPRLALDIGHCQCLEPQPPAECVRRVADQLVHVHIEDMRRGVHEHLALGDGEIDFPPVLGALAAIGYRRMVAVELSRHSHTAHTAVPAAIRFLTTAHKEAPVCTRSAS